MIRFVTIILLLPATFAPAQSLKDSVYNNYFTSKTLRIDLIETGDKESGGISISQLKQEPYWGGSRVNLIDTFGYGGYRYLIYDSAEQKLLFSRGYCTLFQEWRTTEEAKTSKRSFYESVVLPFPKKTIRFELQARNKNMEFDTLLTSFINPASLFINKEKPPSFNWYYIHKTGEPKSKADVVIIPDGYTLKEMKKFREDASRFTGYVFNTSPFKENKDKFNVVAIEAVSEESGTDIPGENIWKNTILNTTFYTFNSERYLTVMDYKALRDIAGIVPYDQIIVIVNSQKYGGGGIFNFFSVVSGYNIFSEYVCVHEFGHSFAGLADEYYNSEVAVENYYSLSDEPWEPNITTLVDFDRKWKKLIPKSIPVPTPNTPEFSGKTGLFEGGGYLAKGIYRPSYDCTMKSVSVNNFCQICKLAIQRMIDFYSE